MATRSEDRQRQLFQAFAAMDDDRSGSIELHEMVHAIQQVKPDMPRDKVVQLATMFFSAMDTDRSNSVTFDEFVRVMESSHIDVSMFVDVTKRQHLQKQASRGAHTPLVPSNTYSPGQAYQWEIPYQQLAMGEVLGEGSFGIVRAARWRGAKVAVKELKSLTSEEALADFKQELEVVNRLRHPNVVLLLGASTQPPHLCMVTEFMDGGTLFELVHKRRENLLANMQRFIHIALDMARGMNYLHLNQPQIIHRDLKSLNVLLDHNYNAKVADFGLSSAKADSGLLTKGMVGTPLWMAPELIRSERYGAPVDVYSFAVVLWEMIECKIPFAGMQPMQVAAGVAYQDMRPPLRNPSCPRWLSELVVQCWHPRPERRPNFQQIISIFERHQR